MGLALIAIGFLFHTERPVNDVPRVIPEIVTAKDFERRSQLARAELLAELSTSVPMGKHVFTSDEYGFAMNVPDDWRKVKGVAERPIARFVKSDGSDRLVAFAISEIPLSGSAKEQSRAGDFPTPDATPERLFSVYQDTIRGVFPTAQMRLVTSGRRQIGGLTAVWFEVDCSYPEPLAARTRMYFMRTKKGQFIDIRTSTDRDEKRISQTRQEFDSMLDSIRFAD